MYNNILVPLDGSEVAECVLSDVEALAIGSKAPQITFLYVIQPLDVPMTRPEFRSRIEAEAKSAASDYLDNLIGKLEYKEAAHAEVVRGKVAETIVDYAIQRKTDLIVMATHGLSGVGRWVRGSVADKVLQKSKTPIWLVRAGASRKTTYEKGKRIKVLVPLDGSELAEAVLVHAREISKQFSPQATDMVLLRVCELFFPPYTYPPPTPLSWEEYLDYETKRCKEICQKYLAKVESQLKEEGLNVSSEIPMGNSADTIVDYANKNDFNLIVMSTHGRTGLGRWAFGSVAEKVLKGASCPILLIRNPG